MTWQVGFKIIHPLNPDWGVGEVVTVGAQQRSLQVRFPGLDAVVTLSTERAVFKRFVFPPGSRVRLRTGDVDDLVTIETPEGLLEEGEGAGFIVYRTREGARLDERNIEAVSLPSGPADRLAQLDVGGLEAYENRIAGVRLAQERQASGLGGVLGARIKLFPHQLYVAQRLLRHLPIRALLADEVGLGKTIEAGMIFSALRQAGRADRVLVLTPSSLSVQWMGELFRKFHTVFTLLDEERLKDAQLDHPDLSPFEVHPRVVMSIDFFAESGLVLDAMKLEGGWDLVIVDEAHHLQWDLDGGNLPYQAVEKTLPNARSVLFLTATPMELDRHEYFALLRLLHPTLFPDETLFSQQLTDMGRANDLLRALGGADGEGATKLFPVQVPDLVEDAFPDTPHLHELAHKVAEGKPGAVADLIDALTWLHPLGDIVISNRRSRVGGFPPRTVTRVRAALDEERYALYQDTLDVLRELMTLAPEEVEDAALTRLARTVRASLGMLPALVEDLEALSRLKWAAPVRQEMRELAERARKLVLAPHPKLDALIHIIRQAVDKGEKLLVFVESVSALLALQERIEGRAGCRCAVFHEDLAAKERDLQVALFRNPEGYPVLLSTESGGEGRNFQFCHRLVHFDLPWEPSRIEQRIGRLDRIGQTFEVESTVFLIEDTVEEQAVTLLDERVGVFRQTVGGLEPVLEGVGSAIRELIFSDEGDDADMWQRLGRGISNRMSKARDSVAQGLDHLLHRSGYDPASGEELVTTLPDDFDDRLEEFVLEFCEEVGISVHDRSEQQAYALELGRYFKLEGLTGVEHGALFVGSFNRDAAVAREDIDFFATGHPLVEGIFSHLDESEYGTTALRRYHSTEHKGGIGVQFNFRLSPRLGRFVDLPAFFPPRLEVIPVDLDGTLRPELVDLLTARYSQAEEMEAEELHAHQESLAKAVRRALDIARDEAQRRFEAAVEAARLDLEVYAANEREREETWYLYQVARVQSYLEEFPEHRDVLLEERESLKATRHHREAERRAMAEALGDGEPILDSAALYLIEGPRKKRR